LTRFTGGERQLPQRANLFDTGPIGRAVSEHRAVVRRSRHREPLSPRLYVAARIDRMNDARVRRARPADKPCLLDLWLRLSADGQAADPRYVLSPHAAEIANVFVEGWATGSQPTWVIEVSGEVVAFIVSKPAAAHPVLDVPASLVITDAYVLDEHRRLGLGRLLYETVRDFAVSEGFRTIEVGTLTKDHRAVSFWRSVGFDDWRVSLSQELQ
jgi:GNAT superfamily N-acetyltransferase